MAPELLQAHALHQAGQHERAERLCQRLLSADPLNADALFLGGIIADEQGKHHEAVALLERAAAQRPDDGSILDNLGLAYGALKRDDEAIATFRRAIQAQPALAESHNNLGLLLKKLGQLEPAFEHFKRAIEAKPDFVVAMNNLAVMLHDAKKHDEALKILNQAMALDQNHADTFCNMGAVLLAKHEIDLAIRVLNRAAQLTPHSGAIHFNIGRAHQECRRYTEAIEAYQRSLSAAPTFAQTLNNLGASLHALDRFDEAEEAFEAAIAVEPEHALAHWNRALLWLRCGKWRDGWREYEWRWQTDDFPSPTRDFHQPLWDGRKQQDATILLHAEQGLGDTIQFIRFTPLVARKVKRVLFLCPPKLARLLGKAEGIDELLLDDGSPLPSFDLHAPLMSLPHLLTVEESSLRTSLAYLQAEADLVSQWRQRLSGQASFRVGLCWQGSNTYNDDDLRSFAPSAFAPLFDLKGVSFISLQAGYGHEQLERDGLLEQMCCYDELDSGGDAFIDSAAIIAGLDLVITADTSIGHLAGALGKPVWLLLTKHGDWRWMHERLDTPWYEHTRLFRQESTDDWAQLMTTVRAELTKHIATKLREASV